MSVRVKGASSEPLIGQADEGQPKIESGIGGTGSVVGDVPHTIAGGQRLIISPLAVGWSYDAWVFARAIMLQ